jgi:hypothetical protein
MQKRKEKKLVASCKRQAASKQLPNYPITGGVFYGQLPINHHPIHNSKFRHGSKKNPCQ